ncbi:MAG: 3-deoxy-manno-octulosonate cytidylyltransferase [Acidobacteriota bacterium]
MDRGRTVAVIPARYGSTRFPGKPLALLHGTPMVAHVVARAREAGCFDEVLVATDDGRVADAARSAGALPVITGEARTGTDRVAQAVRNRDAAIVVNVQGDEPALPPESLRRLVAWLREHAETPIATLALPCDEGDLGNPTVVKVVTDLGGRAMYFSRSAVPFPRNPKPDVHRKHVGLYGFQRDALFAFTSLPESELEAVEGLEQLRALVNGIAIQVLDAAGESVAVDVPDDVPRAEAAIAKLCSGVRGPGSGTGHEVPGTRR